MVQTAQDAQNSGEKRNGIYKGVEKGMKTKLLRKIRARYLLIYSRKRYEREVWFVVSKMRPRLLLRTIGIGGVLMWYITKNPINFSCLIYMAWKRERRYSRKINKQKLEEVMSQL